MSGIAVLRTVALAWGVVLLTTSLASAASIQVRASQLTPGSDSWAVQILTDVAIEQAVIHMEGTASFVRQAVSGLANAQNGIAAGGTLASQDAASPWEQFAASSLSLGSGRILELDGGLAFGLLGGPGVIDLGIATGLSGVSYGASVQAFFPDGWRDGNGTSIDPALLGFTTLAAPEPSALLLLGAALSALLLARRRARPAADCG